MKIIKGIQLASIITVFLSLIGKAIILKNKNIELIECFSPIKKDGLNWNNIFFYLMLILFCVYIMRRIFADRERVKAIDDFYKKINRTDKILIRSELSDLINEINNVEYTKDIKELWGNFSSSIIDIEKEGDEGRIKEVYQTIDSEYFFNTDTLLKEKMNFKLLNYIPQGLVGLGLLGTFLGLALGLESLNLKPEFIQKSIEDLISGVKTSFYTSLYGMYFSIAFSFIINMYIGEYEEKITKLKDKLNNLFNKNIGDRTILNIKKEIKQLVVRTDSMAESLANELQKGLGEIKQSNKILVNEIGETINNKMGAMTTNFNESFEKNIGESLEKIFSSDFVEKFENIKDQLIEVSEKNNSFISAYKNEIKEIVDKTGEVKEEFELTSEKIILNFEKFNEKIEFSFKNLDIMYDNSLQSYERINNVFEKSKQQMLELEGFMKKTENITNSLDNFIESEKEVVGLWQNYKESFESLNSTINTGVKNYEENIRITSNKYENVLKDNFEKYKQITEQIANEYTKEIKQGVSFLFTEYDTQLSETVNKFSSVISLFNEKLDDSNQILNSHREILNVNKKQIDYFKDIVKFQDEK